VPQCSLPAIAHSNTSCLASMVTQMPAVPKPLLSVCVAKQRATKRPIHLCVLTCLLWVKGLSAQVNCVQRRRCRQSEYAWLPQTPVSVGRCVRKNCKISQHSTALTTLDTRHACASHASRNHTCVTLPAPPPNATARLCRAYTYQAVKSHRHTIRHQPLTRFTTGTPKHPPDSHADPIFCQRGDRSNIKTSQNLNVFSSLARAIHKTQGQHACARGLHGCSH
jgi:hypothetical protein